ncbi:MAG: ABC transporter ATP-binding protein [Chloroflexi bacterium]|nr:ABC transporter ATP-binding protein [Chloroflexota bacterium]
MNATTVPFLKIDQVSKAFIGGARPVQALQAVSFEVVAGEFVSLLGPSGSGKSTLLRIIGGLLAPDTGAVLLEGTPLIAPHPEIGFVFQTTNLMPWRTILQNVLLPLEIQGKLDENATQTARDLLALVGLTGFEDAYPKQLSGGMRQRVVLARTLIHRPQLLLMDEPFGALDALTRERLNLELLRIQQIQTKTVIMVTHSIPEAVFLADRVLIFGERPGRVVAELAIDLPRPRHLAQMGSAHFGQLTMQVRQHIDELASMVENKTLDY